MLFVVSVLKAQETICIKAGNQKNVYQNTEKPNYNIDKDSLAVKGYDVTEYFIKNKATQGYAEYKSKYNGINYFFLNERNKSIFTENPEKYLPQYGGYCADKMGATFVGGSKPGKHDSNPEYFMVIDGKLYLFSYKSDLYFKRWMQNIDVNLANANKAWAAISKLN